MKAFFLFRYFFFVFSPSFLFSFAFNELVRCHRSSYVSRKSRTNDCHSLYPGLFKKQVVILSIPLGVRRRHNGYDNILHRTLYSKDDSWIRLHYAYKLKEEKSERVISMNSQSTFHFIQIHRMTTVSMRSQLQTVLAVCCFWDIKIDILYESQRK